MWRIHNKGNSDYRWCKPILGLLQVVNYIWKVKSFQFVLFQKTNRIWKQATAENVRWFIHLLIYLVAKKQSRDHIDHLNSQYTILMLFTLVQVMKLAWGWMWNQEAGRHYTSSIPLAFWEAQSWWKTPQRLSQHSRGQHTAKDKRRNKLVRMLSRYHNTCVLPLPVQRWTLWQVVGIETLLPPGAIETET